MLSTIDTIDSVENQNTFWEHVATTRWGKYLSEVEQRNIVRASQLAGSPTVALDIGCEGGRWSQLLADQGWDLVCTDVNPQVLDLCQQRLPASQCILVNPDDNTLPCESGTVRLLLCIEVDAVNQPWFTAEAYRVLEVGGVIAVMTWNLLSLRSLYVHVKAWFSDDPDDSYQIPYATFRRGLTRSGFEILAEEGYCWFPFWRESDSTLVPATTKVEQWLGLRKLPTVSPWVVTIAKKTPGAAEPALIARGNNGQN
jgi:SAM-dependent methyltransferase